jgi:ankyrin repeat protein
MCGDKAVVKVLLAAGARNDFKDVSGKSATEYALTNRFSEIATLLQKLP